MNFWSTQTRVFDASQSKIVTAPENLQLSWALRDLPWNIVISIKVTLSVLVSGISKLASSSSYIR
jgi:hypothetical protein